MHIGLISTGGTIATTVDEAGAKPRLHAEELIEDVPALADETEVTTFDIFTKPSTHVTPSDMAEISALVSDIADANDVDAVIITHGTDTIEETAYFLHRTYAGDMPVLLTGAMRKSTDTGADGPANILAALQFAQSDYLRGIGPVVVMADQAFAARDVTKVHSNTISAFGSLGHGPIGTIVEGQPEISYLPVDRGSPLSLIPEEITNEVVILTASAGVSLTLFEAAQDAAGVVIAGTGGGRVPPTVVKAIEELRNQDIPVLMVPRSPAGYPSYRTYDFPGAGKNLKEIGVHFSKLPPWKARLKLITAIASEEPVDIVL